jgi:hypothetical protein
MTPRDRDASLAAPRRGGAIQLSFHQEARRAVGSIDLGKALATVQGPVRDAVLGVSAQLTALGVRHALAGDVAVAAHGYLRETRDVDFLVGEEAFEQHGPLVTFRPGVPVAAGGIAVDYLSPSALGPQLEETLDAPLRVDGLPIVPVEVLVYMKVAAHRRRDQNDVIELVRIGIDVPLCRAYLARHAPDLVARLEALVAAAEGGE